MIYKSCITCLHCKFAPLGKWHCLKDMKLGVRCEHYIREERCPAHMG
jgi:hypothetical protein